MTKEFLYRELSFQIIGLVYKVYNELGFGHREKIYQRALTQELIISQIHFDKEYYVPIFYNNKIISKYYFDLLVEKKIIIELKVGNEILDSYIDQALSYLKSTDIKLALIFVITKRGVKIKRLIN